MTESLLSVIVPVYNVAQYLDRCLVSIVNQTYHRLEIILVDDGSTDTSPKICEDWAKRDNRIKVIHKINAGLGYARNAGIAKATGDYIAFVDSDDHLRTDAYAIMMEQLTNTRVQVGYYGHFDVWPAVTTTLESPAQSEIITGDRLESFTCNVIAPASNTTKEPFTGVSAWSAIYLRSFLMDNHLFFFSEREVISEDVFFNTMVSLDADNILVVPDYLYFYDHRNDSLSRKHRDDKWLCSKSMVHKLRSIIAKHADISGYEERLDRLLMINLLVCMKQEFSLIGIKGWKHIYRYVKSLCMDNTTKRVLNRYPIKKMPIKQRVFYSSVKRKLIIIVIMLVWFKLRGEQV